MGLGANPSRGTSWPDGPADFMNERTGFPDNRGSANITDTLVSFTGKFAGILELVSKLTDVLVSLLVIYYALLVIFFHADNLARLPFFFGGSSFRGITRFK